MCTDETSAYKFSRHVPAKQRVLRMLAGGRDFCLVGTTSAVPRHARLRQGFLQGRNGTGVGRNNPNFFEYEVTQRGTMQYRCIASSPEGLVQQVAVCYMRHGYWWYVTGRIPKGKDPAAVDAKLIEKYGIALTDRQRAYRKKRGLANMQYIRYRDWFLLLATEGHHQIGRASCRERV
jgi:hypothetical protein